MGLFTDQGAGPCELKSRTRNLQVTFNVIFRNLRLREESEELLSSHTTLQVFAMQGSIFFLLSLL